MLVKDVLQMVTKENQKVRIHEMFENVAIITGNVDELKEYEDIEVMVSEH